MGLFRLPDKLASASEPWWLVCRPLAASLLLTHCGGDLMAFFQGCTLFRFNEKDFRDVSLQASTLRRKRKRSGKRPAHQAGRRMQKQICLAAGTVCGCTLDLHPRGWVRRAGNTPPYAASFFPYSFFAGEERIWPPEGDSPLAWKKIRRSSFRPRKKRSSPHCSA